MNDLELWTQLKQGKHQALKQIYEQNIKSLDNYAQKFTDDVALIEDTIHDVFVQIWQKKESLGNTDSIIKYLCVTVRRELIRRIEKSYKTTSIDTVESQSAEFSLSIEDMLISDETKNINIQKLRVAMDGLSGRQKEAIYLRYYEELEYEQICEVMDINYQSVRNLISKGVIELRNHLTSLILWMSWFIFSI